MQSRRLEHPGKHRFWEVFWERDEAEVVTGALGTQGRARRREFGSALACKEFVETEVASRQKQGFVEVLPEAVQASQAPRLDDAAETSAWLARIAEAFDDDAPRLVYADWLQTQGDPLGELIAVQCALAQLADWDPRTRALREREDHLIATFRNRWVPPVAGVELVFHRGFVERVRLGHPFDRSAFEQVVAAAPLLRTLEVTSSGSPGAVILDALLAIDTSFLTGLFLRGYRLTAGDVDRLVDAPGLSGVARLGLRGANLDSAAARPLARRAWRELDLHQNILGVRGMQHVLASAAQLVALDLGSTGVGDDGVRLLAQTALPMLERLSLRRTTLSARSLGALAAARGLPRLRSLDLAHTPLDRAAVAALLEAPALPALVELDLRETGLDDAAALALARSPLAARVVALDLGKNEIGDAGARALAEAKLPALRSLNVSGNPLTATTLKAALPHVRVIARTRAPAVRPERPAPVFAVGDKIRVLRGPFEQSLAIVERVRPEVRKLRATLVVLGALTSVELDYAQVEHA